MKTGISVIVLFLAFLFSSCSPVEESTQEIVQIGNKTIVSSWGSYNEPNTGSLSNILDGDNETSYGFYKTSRKTIDEQFTVEILFESAYVSTIGFSIYNRSLGYVGLVNSVDCNIDLRDALGVWKVYSTKHSGTRVLDSFATTKIGYNISGIRITLAASAKANPLYIDDAFDKIVDMRIREIVISN